VTAPMVAGINLREQDYGAYATFPGARISRVFAGPGEGILPWTAQRLAGLPSTVVPHLSFKDWPSDSAAAKAVTALLDVMPRRYVTGDLLSPELGCSVALSHMHEPENNGLPVRTWRQRQRVLYDAVKSHQYGSRVAVVPIQTLQWTTFAGKGNGDVFAWWAGIGDFAGIDCYANSWEPGYPDAEAFLALPLRLAAGTGRRLMLPELGAVRLPTDFDGSKRAAWMTAVVARLADAGCAAVSWWSAPGANAKDFRLADPPSVAAWQGILSGAF
jgi:hypothetical protein